MENMQLKYVEVIFDKEKPQSMGTEIKIIGKIDEDISNLEYKFIVGKGGIWKTIQDFSINNECLWVPDSAGNYIVMVQAREKDGKKPLDYLAKQDYIICDKESMDNYNNNSNLSNEDINHMKTEEEKFEDIIEYKEKEDIISISSLNTDEKKILTEDFQNKESVNISTSKEKIIEEVALDKDEITVGEKCSIEVKSYYDNNMLYRFYIKRYKDWDIIRDYETDNILKYTATQVGEKEFLIQCKRIESNEVFDDYRTIKVNVKEMRQLTINNFKCENKDLLVGEQLRFKVETNYHDETVLYKFYKIYENGRSTCIQEYSNNNVVCYDESQSGNYRILCLAKNILSNKEYDDRAIFVYTVKAYKDISIKNFIADLNSPQAIGSDIRLTSEIDGGKKLLYRYVVKGVIEEDTGFISDDEYIWSPKEVGEYEIIMYVKDSSYDGDYEDCRRINFLIEKKGEKPIKIVDVIVDKDRNTLINDPVNIMVKCESDAHVLYCFNIRRNGSLINKSDYNKSNWIDFTPNKTGEYEIEIMVKDKYSEKEYDAHTFVYLKVLDYLPAKIDYIIMPYKESHLIGDIISFECIVQDTQNILMKYETKINGRKVEETDYIKDKKLRFTPKVAGKYTIDVYAKNVKCKDEFDFKKQVNIYVSEALPVINTNIVTNKKEFKINEEITFDVFNKGGKDVCYEFYLMRNNTWERVQAYSRKKYYSFIPFTAGKYKILALVKSFYKKVNYEDYDELSFEVKDI